MNPVSGLALLLYLTAFLLVCAALLLLPFFPAWSEWQRPTDRQALRLATGDDSQASLARLLRQQLTQLASGDHPPPLGSLDQALTDSASMQRAELNLSTTTADPATDAPLRLAQGSSFRQIEAVEIAFGLPTVHSGPDTEPPRESLPVHPPLHGAQPWGSGGWRLDGDCAIQEGHIFTGSLVVTGVLSIGDGARLDGDVKAHRGVVIGQHAQVNGSVISDGGIRVFDHAFVGGPLIAESLLQIGAGVRLGSRHAPTSVSAQVILVADGTTVNGSVWATQVGRVWGAA